MKVMYLSFNDPLLSPGVFRKEHELCETLGDMGKERGIEFKGLGTVASTASIPEVARFGKYYHLRKIPSLPYRAFSAIPLFCSLFRIRPVFTEAYREITAFGPDVLLWRYAITSVPGVFNPKRVSPGLLLVTEHQAKEMDELRMTSAGRLMAPLVERNGRKVLSQVDGVIGVTSEITRHELFVMGRPVPSCTLTNSIDVDRYRMKSPAELTGNVVRLLYVGSHSAQWQGLDRIFEGIARHRGNPEVELHVAGSLTGDSRRLIRSLGIEGSVVDHGFVAGRALDKLFDLCHCAVGTLGMHRKGLSLGSTLKVREYMARGIPFVISHLDEDIPSDLPFVFTAPADDTPIDMGEVIRFTRDALHTHGPDLPQEMREYARGHMDYRIKVEKLIAFLSSLVHGRRS